MHVLFALGSGSAHFADDGDHFVQTGFLYYDDSGNCSELCIPDCPAGTSQTLSDSVGHRLFAANVGTMGLDCILRNMGKLIGISVLPETPRWFINITIMDFTNLRPILAAGWWQPVKGLYLILGFPLAEYSYLMTLFPRF